MAKQIIFKDAIDKRKFLQIIERHLDPQNTDCRADGVAYYKYTKDLELLCYCLMGNHFHLLFYIKGDGRALAGFMQSISIAYSMYFNKRYRRVGTLFQGVFKASMITNESYLLHITRYIHLNPRTYRTYFYSSLAYYLGKPLPLWLNSHRVLEMFEPDEYLAFIEDYNDYQQALNDIEHELANK